MMRSRLAYALALAGAIILGGGPARAQPHAPLTSLQPDGTQAAVDSANQRVTELSQVDVWLRRLVGRFSYEGIVDLGAKGNLEDLKSVHGVSDCVAVGAGPGVQCVLNVLWEETWGPMGQERMGGVSNLAPAMSQFGLDLDAVGVRYLLVDGKGIADFAGTGILRGNTATFRMICVNQPSGCQRTTRITARPDSSIVEMRTDFEVFNESRVTYMFSLRRLTDGEPGATSTVLPARGVADRPQTGNGRARTPSRGGRSR
jgi:hypothetical protein